MQVNPRSFHVRRQLRSSQRDLRCPKVRKALITSAFLHVGRGGKKRQVVPTAAPFLPRMRCTRVHDVGNLIQ